MFCTFTSTRCTSAQHFGQYHSKPSSTSLGRTFSTTMPTVPAGRCGEWRQRPGISRISPSRIGTSRGFPFSRMRSTMSPRSWKKNSSYGSSWKSVRAFGPPTTWTIRSSASRNTIWLPTGGLSRCACSSIQREKLKAASMLLESEGEADLRVGAVALAVGGLVAIDVGLVDPAETDEGIAPRLDIDTGARPRGIEIIPAFDLGAPVEGADVGLHRLHLVEDVLHGRRDFRQLGIGSGPELDRQAGVQSVHQVVARAHAEHEVALVERVAGAGGGHQVRLAFAESAGNADALRHRRQGERACCRGDCSGQCLLHVVLPVSSV